MTDAAKSHLRRMGGHAAVVAAAALASVQAVEARVDAALKTKLETERFVLDSVNRHHLQTETAGEIRRLRATADSTLACVRDLAYRQPVRGCR